MKLTDLKPRWLSPDVFTFLCPHCQVVTLLCKRVPLTFKEQVKLVNSAPEDDEDWPHDFVPMKQDTAWNIVGDFPVMTVTPSIDASASGHWHGFIKNGEIL